MLRNQLLLIDWHVFLTLSKHRQKLINPRYDVVLFFGGFLFRRWKLFLGRWFFHACLSLHTSSLLLHGFLLHHHLLLSHLELLHLHLELQPLEKHRVLVELLIRIFGSVFLTKKVFLNFSKSKILLNDCLILRVQRETPAILLRNWLLLNPLQNLGIGHMDHCILLESGRLFFGRISIQARKLKNAESRYFWIDQRQNAII